MADTSPKLKQTNTNNKNQEQVVTKIDSLVNSITTELKEGFSMIAKQFNNKPTTTQIEEVDMECPIVRMESSQNTTQDNNAVKNYRENRLKQNTNFEMRKDEVPIDNQSEDKQPEKVRQRNTRKNQKK